MINCNSKLIKFKYQGCGGLEVFISTNNKYFIKKYLKKQKYLKQLYKVLKFYIEIKKTPFKIFVPKIYRNLNCKSYFLFVSEKADDSIRYIINELSINEIKNIMLQVILFIFNLNYKLKIKHNDLHLENILFTKIDKNINFNEIINNQKFNLTIKKYLIKIIDYDGSKEYKDNKNVENKIIINIINKLKTKNKNYYYEIIKYMNPNKLSDLLYFIFLLLAIINMNGKYNIDIFLNKIYDIYTNKKLNIWEKELKIYDLIKYKLKYILIKK